MNLDQSLTEIANRFNFDAAQLIEYAHEDTIGGFHFDETLRKWPTGSIWEVDGQILYALARAMPRSPVIVELGSHYGASANHFLAALNKDGGGKLIAVDVQHYWEVNDLKAVRVFHEAITWLEKQEDASIDILFEDLGHGQTETRNAWTLGLSKVKAGGFIISHDATHHLVGTEITGGIRDALGDKMSDVLVLTTEPADTGLAIYQAPRTKDYTDFEVVKLNSETQGYTPTTSDAIVKPKRQPKPKAERKPRAPKAKK